MASDKTLKLACKIAKILDGETTEEGLNALGIVVICLIEKTIKPELRLKILQDYCQHLISNLRTE